MILTITLVAVAFSGGFLFGAFFMYCNARTVFNRLVKSDRVLQEVINKTKPFQGTTIPDEMPDDLR